MTLQMQDPPHIDEPQDAQKYADILGRVAADRQPVIVRRGGSDLAAVVPLEFIELVKDMLAREHAEDIARNLDWPRLLKAYPPSQEWFDRDEPKPF
jgi:hypothetical protein